MQRTKAMQFRDMHRSPAMLTLPNAWDVMSARIFESAGFRAIGTTSYGIAASRGYPDGELVPFCDMLASVREITASVSVPVTADIESGYGSTLDEVSEHVEQFLDAGIVGVNIEAPVHDSVHTSDELAKQASIVELIRKCADKRDLPLFINARIDTLVDCTVPDETLLQDTLARAAVLVEAGADCIFVFGDHDESTITRLVKGIQGPVSLLAGPRTPPVATLQKLGVARVSIGPGAFRAACSVVAEVARDLVVNGTYERFVYAPTSYASLQRYLHDGQMPQSAERQVPEHRNVQNVRKGV